MALKALVASVLLSALVALTLVGLMASVALVFDVVGRFLMALVPLVVGLMALVA